VHIRRRGGQLEAVHLDAAFRGWRSDQILASPAFELPATHDEETERMLVKYRQLDALTDPDEAQLQELRDLELSIAARLGRPETGLVERTGASIAREWLDDRLSDVPLEERITLMYEAERYLASLERRANPDAAR
jgi:hypothetical protein